MNRGTELHEMLEEVRDRASFLDFVRALETDRRAEVVLEQAAPSSPYGPGAKGWENGTIEDFLESAVAWADDIQRTGDERADWFPEAPSWAAFARFLYLGKIYE